MEHEVEIRQVLAAMLARQRDMSNIVRPKGKLRTELWRGGKIIDVREVANGVTNIGKDSMLDTFFLGNGLPAGWYHGLINNAGYSAVAAADTMASHAGWAEFTAYTPGARPEWQPSAPSGQAVTNASPMEFTITSAGTLQGGFIVTNDTKGGTTGILWATALYGTPLVVAISDIVRNTYTTSLT